MIAACDLHRQRIARSEREGTVKIQIIGPKEDPSFRHLRDVFLGAVHELQVEATIDLVTRQDEMQKMPRTAYPAVIIDGHLMCQGHVITLVRAKECVRQFIQIIQ